MTCVCLWRDAACLYGAEATFAGSLRRWAVVVVVMVFWTLFTDCVACLGREPRSPFPTPLGPCAGVWRKGLWFMLVLVLICQCQCSCPPYTHSTSACADTLCCEKESLSVPYLRGPPVAQRLPDAHENPENPEKWLLTGQSPAYLCRLFVYCPALRLLANCRELQVTWLSNNPALVQLSMAEYGERTAFLLVGSTP